MRDPYLYPDSKILRNLADIHDVDMLRNMEADYSSFRLSEIVADDIEMAYDFDTLCNMHHHIFQDIYEWAGKPRVINTRLYNFINDTLVAESTVLGH